MIWEDGIEVIQIPKNPPGYTEQHNPLNRDDQGVPIMGFTGTTSPRSENPLILCRINLTFCAVIIVKSTTHLANL